MATSPPISQADTAQPHLKRVLGRWDLVLLFVVAIANLNVVPVVAASGAFTLALWIIALLLFFWPQGIAVIELAQRYPGEGGIYLWTKRLFGDFHGFVSGWCYWTNNIFYVPTVLLYLVGICVYVAGPKAATLADDKGFALPLALGFLWVLAGLNVRGLSVGKWVNNFGGVSTAITATVLFGLAAWVVHLHGSTLPAGSFSFSGPNRPDWRMLSTFGVICFGLVGLELASVMGDEISDPARSLPPAVVWGGILSGALYLGATVAVLMAVPLKEIGVVQGILQAITRLASTVSLGWLVPPLALLLTLSTAGIASAWFAGSARIPFVAGLDRYLPPALGKIHPRYLTPYVSLLVQAAFSSAFLAMSFVGASVKEAYLTMLDLAVILQLIPFLYMYAGLVRLARGGAVRAGSGEGRYSRRKLMLAGTSGLTTTALGMGLAFVPSRTIKSTGLFELKMVVGTFLFVVVASIFFRASAARKPRPSVPVDFGQKGDGQYGGGY